MQPGAITKRRKDMSELTCFKVYDIRGEIGVNIDADIAYRIGKAVAQHFCAKSLVVGFDARKTSPAFAKAASKGALDAGSDVINIGMAGTEEMYWAVTEFGACAGIEITASHNPINYNGMKIVKSNSQPLDNFNDFLVIKALASSQSWLDFAAAGRERDRSDEARQGYVERVLSFIDASAFQPLKIVVNSGNGAAGPTFDAIAQRLEALGAPLEFVRVHHEPDPAFPNGIPNPLLSQNHAATADVVISEAADFGVAFDGDFDRCFFFDENGKFVPSEYVVGLLASVFLEKKDSSLIVHDPRLVWNIQDIVGRQAGVSIQSKTGHAFIKQTMRSEQAVYGGEASGHHYFRDFAYCDSGMIPWLLVAEFISRTRRSIGNWVKDRFTAFPSSGEINFRVDDAAKVIDNVLQVYRRDAISVDTTDGVSLAFMDWRFNLRRSNTEPLVRLNIETKGRAENLETYVNAIAKLIGGTRT